VIGFGPSGPALLSEMRRHALLPPEPADAELLEAFRADLYAQL
jgi:hypothetical protein